MKYDGWKQGKSISHFLNFKEAKRFEIGDIGYFLLW